MEATGKQKVEVHFFSAWSAEGGVGPRISTRKGPRGEQEGRKLSPPLLPFLRGLALSGITLAGTYQRIKQITVY